MGFDGPCRNRRSSCRHPQFRSFRKRLFGPQPSSKRDDDAAQRLLAVTIPVLRRAVDEEFRAPECLTFDLCQRCDHLPEVGMILPHSHNPKALGERTQRSGALLSWVIFPLPVACPARRHESPIFVEEP